MMCALVSELFKHFPVIKLNEGTVAEYKQVFYVYSCL